MIRNPCERFLRLTVRARSCDIVTGAFAFPSECIASTLAVLPFMVARAVLVGFPACSFVCVCVWRHLINSLRLLPACMMSSVVGKSCDTLHSCHSAPTGKGWLIRKSSVQSKHHLSGLVETDQFVEFTYLSGGLCGLAFGEGSLGSKYAGRSLRGTRTKHTSS